MHSHARYGVWALALAVIAALALTFTFNQTKTASAQTARMCLESGEIDDTSAIGALDVATILDHEGTWSMPTLAGLSGSPSLQDVANAFARDVGGGHTVTVSGTRLRIDSAWFTQIFPTGSADDQRATNAALRLTAATGARLVDCTTVAAKTPLELAREEIAELKTQLATAQSERDARPTQADLDAAAAKARTLEGDIALLRKESIDNANRGNRLANERRWALGQLAELSGNVGTTYTEFSYALRAVADRLSYAPTVVYDSGWQSRALDAESGLSAWIAKATADAIAFEKNIDAANARVLAAQQANSALIERLVRDNDALRAERTTLRARIAHIEYEWGLCTAGDQS